MKIVDCGYFAANKLFKRGIRYQIIYKLLIISIIEAESAFQLTV